MRTAPIIKLTYIMSHKANELHKIKNKCEIITLHEIENKTANKSINSSKPIP